MILPRLYRMADDDTILEWSSHTMLTWQDFWADSNPGAYQNANVSVKYGCTWTVESLPDDTNPCFAIRNIHLATHFVRNLSWVREGTTTDTLLAHAQGYFDLAEETRPEIEVMLKAEYDEKLYPVRGSGQDEQQMYSRQDSRVVLSSLTRLYTDILLPRIAEYEKTTIYGESVEAQQMYNHRFSRLRSG